jgi:hypothetical protein
VTALVCIRLVSGELREVEPANPVVLAKDVYEADREPAIFGPSSSYLSQCTAQAWCAFAPCEPAYVLEVDHSDEYGGFKWVLADLVDAPREDVPTVPAHSSEREIEMAAELQGRTWGAPRRPSRHP